MAERMLFGANREDGLYVGMAANVVVMNWRKPLSQNALWNSAGLVERFVESQSDRIGLVVWLDAGLPAPTGAERRVAANIMGTIADRVAGTVILLDDWGLKEVVWRVTLAAMKHYGIFETAPIICNNIEDACLEMKQVLNLAGVWRGAEFDIVALARAVKQRERG